MRDGTASLRVALAEDAVLFRDMLTQLLTERAGAVVTAVGSATALLDAVAADPPNLVIVDIRLPPSHTTEGLDAAVRIKIEHPDVGVLVLSQHLEHHHLERLLSRGSGGFGYLLKERVTSVDSFLEAVQRVAAGGSAVDPEVVNALLGQQRHAALLRRLSRREQEVLALMAEGRSNQAICTALVLSPKTLETHIRSIFNRLDLAAVDESGGINRRVVAVLMYRRARA